VRHAEGQGLEAVAGVQLGLLAFGSVILAPSMLAARRAQAGARALLTEAMSFGTEGTTWVNSNVS
jgi:hypothetical protein